MTGLLRFRQAFRVLAFGLVAYNVGARDWNGLLGTVFLLLSVEAAVAFQRWADHRHAAIVRRRERLARRVPRGVPR